MVVRGGEAYSDRFFVNICLYLDYIAAASFIFTISSHIPRIHNIPDIHYIPYIHHIYCICYWSEYRHK